MAWSSVETRIQKLNWLMKKFISIGILIVIGIIIFVGYYPSFFPFIRYGIFPQLVTKEVFRIENFLDPEKNFSGFLEAVENIVHQSWDREAKLVFITASLVPKTNQREVSYEMIFSRFPPNVKAGSTGLNELSVFYNAELIVTEFHFLEDPLSPDNSFLNKFFKVRIHEPRIVNNKTLLARECIDEFFCQWIRLGAGQEMEINLNEIKVSGKQAFELFLIRNPELIKKEYTATGFLRKIENIPIWLLGPPKIKIDAKSGKILE